MEAHQHPAIAMPASDFRRMGCLCDLPSLKSLSLEGRALPSNPVT